jgi:hypothetical protein
VPVAFFLQVRRTSSPLATMIATSRREHREIEAWRASPGKGISGLRPLTDAKRMMKFMCLTV